MAASPTSVKNVILVFGSQSFSWWRLPTDRLLWIITTIVCMCVYTCNSKSPTSLGELILSHAFLNRHKHYIQSKVYQAESSEMEQSVEQVPWSIQSLQLIFVKYENGLMDFGSHIESHRMISSHWPWIDLAHFCSIIYIAFRDNPWAILSDIERPWLILITIFNSTCSHSSKLAVS